MNGSGSSRGVDSDLYIFVCVERCLRRAPEALSRTWWHAPVIAVLGQVGEGWRQEDQKFKAIPIFKASGRPLGPLETLFKTNKKPPKALPLGRGLVGRDLKKAWLSRC